MKRDIAIGALERGVRNLAKDLELLGLKTEVNVFRSGPGGFELGPSNVELQVEGTYVDPYGDEQNAWAEVKFVAGGYGSLTDRHQIGSANWKEMKAEGLKRIFADLERQGWKMPP